MPKVTWQTEYENRDPISETDVERARIRELRWELDIDEGNYTLEELEEMINGQRKG